MSSLDSVPILSVATYNIGDFDTEYHSAQGRPKAEPDIHIVAECIGRLDADVVLVQEAPSRQFLDRLADAARLSYTAFDRLLGEEESGVGILSRYPVGNVELSLDKPDDILIGASAAQIIVRGHPIGLCSVHLPPVEKPRDDSGYVRLSALELISVMRREIFGETERSIAAEVLVEGLRKLPLQNVIVGGDFNTVYPARPIRLLHQDFRDTMAGRLGFFQTTYRKSRVLLPARVDFLFYRGSLHVADSSILQETWGDHYPVVARFRF